MTGIKVKVSLQSYRQNRQRSAAPWDHKVNRLFNTAWFIQHCLQNETRYAIPQAVQKLSIGPFIPLHTGVRFLRKFIGVHKLLSLQILKKTLIILTLIKT